MTEETVTVAQAFRAGVREEMARDERIFIIGTDLFIRGGHFAQVKGLGQEFGVERVRDAPISEAAMVAAGVGAAISGMRPIVDLNFLDFAFGAMDEIVNQAAKIRYMWGVGVPMVIRATTGVAFGAAQHSNSLEAWFAHMPGLIVVMPYTPFDTKALIKTALRSNDPVVFLMHKSLSGLRGPVGRLDDTVPFGEGVVRRAGRDVTLITYSAMVGKALTAAGTLAESGIDVEVVDLRSLYPMDWGLIEASVRKTRHVVVATEAPNFGSIAAEISSRIGETFASSLDAPVVRVGGAHSPIPHSPPLAQTLIPQVEDLERAVRRAVQSVSPASGANKF